MTENNCVNDKLKYLYKATQGSRLAIQKEIQYIHYTLLAQKRHFLNNSLKTYDFYVRQLC